MFHFLAEAVLSFHLYNSLLPYLVEYFYNSSTKSLYDYSNINFILALAPRDCLFPNESWSSWFFICFILLDCNLDILNTMLWDSGYILQRILIFGLSSQLTQWIQVASPNQPSVGCDSSVPLQSHSALSYICATQRPVKHLGSGQPCCSVLNVRVRYMHVQIRAEPRSS